MLRNLSDGYHRKGKNSVAYRLDRKCESLYEYVLEVLKQFAAADANF